MANLQQIAFVLDLDDPTSKQLWERLRPLILSGEANALLRGALLQALGLVGHAPSWGLGYAYSTGDLAHTDSTQDILSRSVADTEGWGFSHTVPEAPRRSSRTDADSARRDDSDGLPPPPIS